MIEMAEEGIKIRLGFELSPEDLEKLRKALEQVISEPFDIISGGKPYAPGKYADNKQTEREANEARESLRDQFKDYIKDENNQKKLITKGVNQAEKAVSASLTKGFGIVEDIYGRLKSASPLLQTIEQLFNLAMTLFFMPLGNKLAEVLIPATVDLLDKVVDMWDAFEGKTLGEMFAYAIDYGVKLFGEYFTNIGELLEDQGGLVGGIGTMLQTIGAFIEGPAIGVLNTILTATTVILSHLKEFISLWIAMKAAEMAINAMGIFKDLGAGTMVAVAAIAALAAGATSYGTLTGLGMADGGYVPAKAGGSLRVLGEGGKGEYVIPEDRMGSVGGSTTINVYGYTDSELKTIIRDTVNEQVSQSRIRGSFRWRASET